MTNTGIVPLPCPTSGHGVPFLWSLALHTGRAELDIRLVPTQREAMAEISVFDALLFRGLTAKEELAVPAFPIARLLVLVNDLTRSTGHITRLQGAVLVWRNTAETFVEVPVVIGDVFVTTVTLVLVLYTDLTALVLRTGLTLLTTPVPGDHQHYQGLSNTTQHEIH